MRVISSVVKASKKTWDPYWAFIAQVEPRVCDGKARCQVILSFHYCEYVQPPRIRHIFGLPNERLTNDYLNPQFSARIFPYYYVRHDYGCIG